jgi:hypothetical protein
MGLTCAHAHLPGKARHGTIVAAPPEDRICPASPIAHHALTHHASCAPRYSESPRFRSADHIVDVLSGPTSDLAETTLEISVAS